eukprot:351058-Chlamydomonas_euryale.AAC.8
MISWFTCCHPSLPHICRWRLGKVFHVRCVPSPLSRLSVQCGCAVTVRAVVRTGSAWATALRLAGCPMGSARSASWRSKTYKATLSRGFSEKYPFQHRCILVHDFRAMLLARPR